MGISRRVRPSCATTSVRPAVPSEKSARTLVRAGSAEPSSSEKPEDGGSALPVPAPAGPFENGDAPCACPACGSPAAGEAEASAEGEVDEVGEVTDDLPRRAPAAA